MINIWRDIPLWPGLDGQMEAGDAVVIQDQIVARVRAQPEAGRADPQLEFVRPSAQQVGPNFAAGLAPTVGEDLSRSSAPASCRSPLLQLDRELGLSVGSAPDHAPEQQITPQTEHIHAVRPWNTLG
jgi:hypothetical protein